MTHTCLGNKEHDIDMLTCIALDIFCVDLVMGDIELFSSAIGVSKQLLWLASIGPLVLQGTLNRD
jgi:hypothetical protein